MNGSSQTMKEAELFLGRMQPVHKGHEQIIKKMKNPIIVLVKGKQTSEEKLRNPLPMEYQQELIHKLFPNVTVSVSPNGFLPGIIGYFGKQGIKITKVYAGADRIPGYKQAVENANKKEKNKDYLIDVEFVETERVTSASTVRKAIKEDDFNAFKKSMPEKLWNEFDKMKKLMEGTIPMSFKEFIIESEITTSTENVEVVDKILGKLAKRKKNASKDCDKKVQDKVTVGKK